MRWTRRLLASVPAGHGHGHPNPSAEFGGFHAPHVAPIHQRMSVFVGATMWFWIFYRAYHDGPVVIGMRLPWEHGHGDDHGHEEEPAGASFPSPWGAAPALHEEAELH